MSAPLGTVSFHPFLNSPLRGSDTRKGFQETVPSGLADLIERTFTWQGVPAHWAERMVSAGELSPAMRRVCEADNPLNTHQ